MIKELYKTSFVFASTVIIIVYRIQYSSALGLWAEHTGKGILHTVRIQKPFARRGLGLAAAKRKPRGSQALAPLLYIV